MSEKTCLECGKVVDQVEGRRPRLFCKDTNCKANYHKKKNPKEPGKKLVDNTDWRIIVKDGKFTITPKTEIAKSILDEFFRIPFEKMTAPLQYANNQPQTIENCIIGEPTSFQNALAKGKKRTILEDRAGKIVYDSDKLSATVKDEFRIEDAILNGAGNLEGFKDVIPAILEEDVKKEIEAQIKAIKAEKIPPHRDGQFGRKVWQREQEARIQELQSKLK